MGAALGLAVVSTACEPPAQEAAGLSEEDVAAIRAASKAFAEAMLAGDWATLAGFYSEDAVFMPANEPAVKGRAAIQAWHEAAHATTTQFTAPPVEIDGRGDLAYVWGTYSFTFTPEGAPEPIHDSGKWVAVSRKQPDGSWLTVVNIFNSDLPVPEESAVTAT